MSMRQQRTAGRAVCQAARVAQRVQRAQARRAHEELKRRVYESYRAGMSASAIARLLGLRAGSVRHLLLAVGGMPPKPPRRPAAALSLAQREEISRGLAAGEPVRLIAARVGVHRSTIYREIARGGGREHYRALLAEQAAVDARRRPKPTKLAGNAVLRRVVNAKLAAAWSPQQVAGWLRATHGPAGGSEGMYVSAETLYKSLFVQARGELRRDLHTQLRRAATLRRPRTQQRRGGVDGRGRIPGAVSISARPAEAGDRAVPGHWEGDLLAGANNTWIATLVERHSRFVALVKVSGKDTTSVIDALTAHAHKLPTGLMRTLTWDRGSEMAQHARFSLATDIAVYFADPRSPWQRGSNENTNGLLRQYFPKGQPIGHYSQDHLDAVADQLNTRPRKTLGYRTPAYALAQAVAATP